jgi:uncharacterized protein (TIGR02328 family)
MRLWHYKLLPYLPDRQFRGQLREAVAIMRDWRDKGKTNHLLINRVMEYSKADLASYFWDYDMLYHKRFSVQHKGYMAEFIEFADYTGYNPQPFEGWHDDGYLKVCMANLYEKHIYGVGKSRISDDEWAVLTDGYKTITREEYKI